MIESVAHYLFQMPNIRLFFLLSFISISFSIVCIILVRRYIPLTILYKDNPVIGNISALISIIYGVFVGLTALYLINNISATADAVQREADAVANIYRDAKWLTEPAHSDIHREILNYLDMIIDVEWPLMKSGEVPDHIGDDFINRMNNILMNYKPMNDRDTMIVDHLMNEIKTLYNAREQRLETSNAGLHSEMWLVILIGTVLTIMINYLFGMNVYLQIVTVSAVALMASSMIFLLVTLDRPYQGEFVIEPDSFKNLLLQIEKAPETKKLRQQAPQT